VYSTCSLELEENEEVVEGLGATLMRRMPGRDAGDGFFAAVVNEITGS
jgi:16S rRNA C967 or C1407 C5-methylase (RsmB/RsmF family)